MSRNFRFQAITQRAQNGTFEAKVIIGNFETEKDAQEMCHVFLGLIYSIASEVSEGREFDESVH